MEPSATLVESLDTDPSHPSVQKLRLLVVSEDTSTLHTLPEDGEWVVGRADECHLQIDVPALSRRHALFRIGPPLTVEDLGSVNGTRVRGEKLKAGERVILKIGDTVEIGPVMMVVQRAAKQELSSRPRRLCSHGYFEERLEEECQRAEASGVGFTLLRLKLTGTTSPQAAQRSLAEVLPPTEVIASYGPGEYEVLAPGARPDTYAQKLKSDLEKKGTPLAVAAVAWGKDGKDPDVLLGEANARVEKLAGAPSTVTGAAHVPYKAAANVVVKDPQMEALHQLVVKIAASNISVLLLGETGVGKEVFAEALHANSPRKDGPYLRLNCAGFTETLLESELFGHEKGAFTGAVKTKMGLLESANGGSVLLDEIGEMPLSTQAKLLRVLEQREVLPVGDVKPRPIDVRFIAATHRDLETWVEKGTFRQDLYFRLNGLSLVIPPLRERVVEIESLAKHFISRAAKQFGKSPEPTLAPDALALLKGYRWPGNLRELRNMLERAVLLCADRLITVEELPVDKLTTQPLAVAPPVAAASSGGGSTEFEAERTRILHALEAHGGNQTLAAKALNISRRTMLNRLDAYAIPRPRKATSR